MRRRIAWSILGAALLASSAGHAADALARESARVAIVTSDVERFYALYDDPAIAAQPDVLATRYLADASPGLVEFMAMRRITPERVAKALREKPDLYRDARGCANTLGTPDWPGDLGYWVGYRIVKSYYSRAPDKAAALKAIIEMRDPVAFLAASGWTPGMKL